MGIFGKKKAEFELEFRTPEGSCYLSLKGKVAYKVYEMLMTFPELKRTTRSVKDKTSFEVFEAEDFTGLTMLDDIGIYIPKGAYIKILV